MGAVAPSSLNRRVTTLGDHCSPVSSSSARTHRRQQLSTLLWPNQEYHELPLRPLLLTNPKSNSGHLSSAPPTTASPSSSSSPSVGRLGEPPSTQSVSIGSVGCSLAPRHLLLQPLVAGPPESPASHRARKGSGESSVFGSEPKVPSRLGPIPTG
jgi:hypothetical protein